MPKLCAFGCKAAENGVSVHRFPNPAKFPERFRTWVSLAGGKLETKSDYEHFRNKLVCHIHFTEKDMNRNNRLNALAIPTLNLPAKCKNKVFTAQASVTNELQEKAVSPPSLNTGQSKNKVSTEQASATKVLPAKVTSSPSPNTEQCKNKVSMAHASATNELPAKAVSSPSSDTDDIQNIAANISHTQLDHNYSSSDISKPAISKKDSVHRVYDKNKLLQLDVLRLRRKMEYYSMKLKEAKVLYGKAIQRLTSSLKPVQGIRRDYQGVRMRLQSSKKPMERRFTEQRELLALPIFTQNPKTYPLLSKYFKLPPAKVMDRLLHTIKEKSRKFVVTNAVQSRSKYSPN